MVEVEYSAASGWSNFCRYVLLYPRWSRSWHRQAINRPFFCKPQSDKTPHKPILNLLLFRCSETQTERAANLELCEYPRGFLQDGVHTVRHRHCVLPVVVGHAAVVLPHGHGEPTQLLQLKAAQKTRRIKINHPKPRWRTADDWPSDTLPGLPTGVVNHVDKDSRPDLLKGINVKVEPGGGGGRDGRGVFKSACAAHRGTDEEGASPGLDSVAVPSRRHMAVERLSQQRQRPQRRFGSAPERALTFQSPYKWVQEGWAG